MVSPPPDADPSAPSDRAAPDPAAPDLEGTLRLLPELRSDLLAVVADEYAALANEYGPENVLVLKRLPAGLESVREALVGTDVADGAPSTPRLESLPEHASKVLEEYDPALERLEYEERIELISLVIDGVSRDVPDYLERASDHDAFARDVGQLLLEATRQRRTLEDLDADAHDCLAFLYATNDRFHDELEARGLIERADVIPRVVDLLERDAEGLRERVAASFDAVLALEFEECRRLDRRYLGALTAGAETDLVCLGEAHASVDRTRVEAGRLEDLADGLAVDRIEHGGIEHGASARRDGESDPPPHEAITRFLATGEVTGPASARRIRTDTPRDQLREVAAEIEFLVDRHGGWSYGDVAVAVPAVERVPDARERLRAAGLPTATIGTDALRDDPSVNELYAVVSYNCDHETPVARDRLAARVPGFSPDLVEECTGSSVRRSLERWIVETDLKGRIAREESWVDAREQFGSVRRVLEIAAFVEETDLVAPDWDGLRRMLRDTIEYDAPYVHAVETSHGGGVVVRPVEELKYETREAVFLVDLTDGHYPGDQHLTQLFPTAWVRSMRQFPAVTDPSADDLERTFAPAESGESPSGSSVEAAGRAGDHFDAYHAERARRRLAIGARAARRRLYLCSYRREAGGLRRTVDESRYCTLVDACPAFDLVDVDALEREATIRGRANALEALLEQPRGELERVLREANTGGTANLAETEALFQEIAAVLADDAADDELVEAVRSQFEFAAGEVSRGD